MGLSCNCDYEAEPGDVCWLIPRDFKNYRNWSRSTKCVSCGTRIVASDVCVEFERFKIPDSEFEVRFFGEDGEIPRASHFMCEHCGGLYFSLSDLGYCVDIREDVRGLVAQYAELKEAERAHAAKRPSAGASPAGFAPESGAPPQ